MIEKPIKAHSSIGEFQGPVLELKADPGTRAGVIGDLWQHRRVLFTLARNDFLMRYRGAAFGVMWAVAVPLVQAAVLVLIFSRVVNLTAQPNYSVYVLSGVLPWSYFSMTLGTATTAVVDDRELIQKVWFPRSLLPIVPASAHLIGLGVSLVTMVVAMPILGVTPGLRLIWLLPACALLIALTVALSCGLAILHVYFRDVKYLVQASLIVLFYATPVIYPASFAKDLRALIELNPMTGVLALFRIATVGGEQLWVRPVIISIIAVAVFSMIAVEAYRRHDRLLADLS